MKFTIDIQKITDRTKIENTRNDRYLIIDTKRKKGCIVSYTKHLISKLQELNNNDCDKTSMNTNDKLRDLITELENKEYLIFQLTRL